MGCEREGDYGIFFCHFWGRMEEEDGIGISGRGRGGEMRWDEISAVSFAYCTRLLYTPTVHHPALPSMP